MFFKSFCRKNRIRSYPPSGLFFTPSITILTYFRLKTQQRLQNMQQKLSVILEAVDTGNPVASNHKGLSFPRILWFYRLISLNNFYMFPKEF